MRYKVRASDDAQYKSLLSLLSTRAELFVVSPRRRILGTGDLSQEIRDQIRARGGQIEEDTQYQPG
jgi:hypothetical protein